MARIPEKNAIYIEKREIGSGRPCFIIAEAGVNHNGSFDLARQLIDVAVDAGCDRSEERRVGKECVP